MTEQQIRQNTVAIFEGWVGLKESDGSHMKIINIYNSHTPLTRGYKVKSTDAWCAVSVSAVGIQADLTDIIPPECGCGEQIKLFQAMGRWQENDGYVPQTGDVIYYDWDDNGKGDNTGWPEHVGMVVSVSGSTIKVIEGNKSDAVGYREIAVNARYIRGYGLPDYASKATDEPAEEPAGTYTTYTVDKGDTLWALAERYLDNGTRYTEIMSLNGLASDKIVVGQTLKIPGAGGEAEAPATPQTPTNEPFLVDVKISNLRIRKGPGASYDSAGYCPQGTYTIVETAQAEGYEWGRLKSGAGWIALKYTEKV